MRQSASARANAGFEGGMPGVHSGCDLEMKIEGGLRGCLLRGRFFQKPKLVGLMIAGVSGCREFVFSSPAKIVEKQDRFANAAFPQFGAFREAGHPETSRHGLREGARDGNDSVAVGVALDEAENFPARSRAPADPPATGDCRARDTRNYAVSAPRLTSAQIGRPSNFTVLSLESSRVTDLGPEENCFQGLRARLRTSRRAQLSGFGFAPPKIDS